METQEMLMRRKRILFDFAEIAKAKPNTNCRDCTNLLIASIKTDCREVPIHLMYCKAYTLNAVYNPFTGQDEVPAPGYDMCINKNKGNCQRFIKRI